MKYSRSGAAAKRSYPMPEVGAAAETSYRMPEVRVAARRSYHMPKVRGGGCRRSSGCSGKGEQRGATPCSRSGRAAVRRYPSSKVRSSGCALLEQP